MPRLPTPADGWRAGYQLRVGPRTARDTTDEFDATALHLMVGVFFSSSPDRCQAAATSNSAHFCGKSTRGPSLISLFRSRSRKRSRSLRAAALVPAATAATEARKQAGIGGMRHPTAATIGSGEIPVNRFMRPDRPISPWPCAVAAGPPGDGPRADGRSYGYHPLARSPNVGTAGSSGARSAPPRPLW